jgi:hypothetical protein
MKNTYILFSTNFEKKGYVKLDFFLSSIKSRIIGLQGIQRKFKPWSISKPHHQSTMFNVFLDLQIFIEFI